jgi:hypothetical protein
MCSLFPWQHKISYLFSIFFVKDILRSVEQALIIMLKSEKIYKIWNVWPFLKNFKVQIVYDNRPFKSCAFQFCSTLMLRRRSNEPKKKLKENLLSNFRIRTTDFFAKSTRIWIWNKQIFMFWKKKCSFLRFSYISWNSPFQTPCLRF